jgi:hypothetical protein
MDPSSYTNTYKIMLDVLNFAGQLAAQFGHNRQCSEKVQANFFVHVEAEESRLDIERLISPIEERRLVSNPPCLWC